MKNRIQFGEILHGLVSMAEGNIGAATVLTSLIKASKVIDKASALEGLGAPMQLDMLEIYGEHIWILYKDVCKENIYTMVAVLRANQLGYVGKSEMVKPMTKERLEELTALVIEDLEDDFLTETEWKAL